MSKMTKRAIWWFGFRYWRACRMWANPYLSENSRHIHKFEWDVMCEGWRTICRCGEDKYGYFCFTDELYKILGRRKKS